MFDVTGKIVYDINEGQQAQLSWLGGHMLLDNTYERDFADLSDDWRTVNNVGLVTAALRSTLGPRLMFTQRVATVLNGYDAEGFFGFDLKRVSLRELSYRADMTFEPSAASTIKAGVQTQNDSGRLAIMGYGWTDPSHETVETLRDDRYAGQTWRHGAYVSYRWRASRSWTFSPGVRADRLTLTGETTASPWMSLSWTPTSKWEVTAGTGIYHQYPDLYKVLGPTPGGRDMRAERTWHTDVSVSHQLSDRTTVVASAYTWQERNGMRLLNSEPRILDDQLFWPNYKGQWYANTLQGSSRGLELMIENKNPNGLSGWLSYALSRTRYRDTVQDEEFWGDYDQRHTFNAHGQYRWSHRMSVSALLRYGSNYPLVGYYEERDGDFYVGGLRNTLRLPPYARLDLRVDRSYDFLNWRMTLFGEVLNVLGRQNERREPHRLGDALAYRRVHEDMLGTTPTVGLLIEF